MFKTVKIQASLNDRFTIESQIRDHRVVIDQPKEAGGENKGPTPLEYFLFSIAGCIMSIARIVAMQKKITLRGMSVGVEGDVDVAKLMGKPTESRAGFEQLRLKATIDADLTLDQKKEFLKEVEARCPVADNVQKGTIIKFEPVDCLEKNH